MPVLRWREFSHDLLRLILSRDLPDYSDATFRSLARRLGLEVEAPPADPRPGDVWVACQPDGGWAGIDPAATAGSP